MTTEKTMAIDTLEAPATTLPEGPRTISLALQGGGSHGAFTWGVLDALLEDHRLDFSGISGASAGAVNAVAVAHGFANGGPTAEGRRQLARDTLARVWRGVAGLGSLSSMAQGIARLMTGGWNTDAGNAFNGVLGRWMSPYQSNPLGFNPLRKLLQDEIDFESIGRLQLPKVFVSATQIRTGRAHIFKGRRLSLDALMASACLPQMFQAVEIDGEHYWDGGFSSNPPLGPLIDTCDSRDIVLVQLNPLSREPIPQNAQDIQERVTELNFNSSLLAQMRSIDFINRLIARGALVEASGYKRVRLHRIDGGKAMQELSASSKLSADAAMMDRLFTEGRSAAARWMNRHFDALGSESTIDIRRDYVGSMA
ncbi:patatin-like phospholipase family protein [Xylophilus sp. GOD-11R]|uniref:patatin-like phospholipase family protein n=1 Tax=Xylophilus sp. GOD-11R TaxID=3089814 RepID=UPI00298D0839|nr:patatin-like phospholipase family protein [Xylophilus sp. GOD-11R]WPB57285.1 patatin-like phospholipase family protein [Xylophilus sp. GOD-11R]